MKSEWDADKIMQMKITAFNDVAVLRNLRLQGRNIFSSNSLLQDNMQLLFFVFT